MTPTADERFLIYCESPQITHPHGRTKVNGILVDGDGDINTVWLQTWLSGDMPIEDAEVKRRYFDDPIPDLRVRGSFRCAQCDRHVTVRDTVRLGKIVATAWRAGVSELPLAGLERMLGRSL